jgi:replicative DNA helicase
VNRADISPLARLIQRVDAVADGAPSVDTVATGFPSLDRVLGGGVRRGDLIVLGGDVGCGKSAFALAVALRMAEDGARVALFSGEMTVDRLLERALSIEGRVRVDDLRDGALDDTRRVSVGVAAIRLRDNAPALATIPRGGVETLRASLQRGPELPAVVIIDSLASIAGDETHGEAERAAALRLLKQMALELDTAVVVTAPLPRFSSARADPRPILDDFGAMDGVKQHADVVLAIYREEMYESALGVEGATELLVRKNRNGPTGYVDLYFYQKWMRFEDMLDPDR